MSDGYISGHFSVFRPLEKRAREELAQGKRTVIVLLRDLFELMRRLEYAEIQAAEHHMALVTAEQRNDAAATRRDNNMAKLDTLTGAVEAVYYDAKKQKNGRVSVDGILFRSLLRAWGGPTAVGDKDAYEAEWER